MALCKRPRASTGRGLKRTHQQRVRHKCGAMGSDHLPRQGEDLNVRTNSGCDATPCSQMSSRRGKCGAIGSDHLPRQDEDLNVRTNSGCDATPCSQ